MSIFGAVLTVAVTLLHVYVSMRLWSTPLRKRRIPGWVYVGAWLAVWLMFLLAREFGGHEGGVELALEVAGMHWMASLFIVAVAVFFADLVCGFGLWFRKWAMQIRTAGVVGGLVLVVVAHVQGLRPAVVERHDVVVDELPESLDGTRIAMISDLHMGEMGLGADWLRSRIQQIKALEPNCVVLVGDIFERSSDPAALIPVLRELSAPLGVFAVRGNHDSLRPSRRDVFGEICTGAEIRVLSNEWLELSDGLVIAGIDDLTISRRRPGEGEGNLERALAGRSAGATVLLSHTPWLVEMAAGNGVDLMLSGHTHNGQIWPFGFLVRARYPLISGEYTIDGMTLIVSRGAGTWGPRMRLWLPGDITLVTLRSGSVTIDANAN